VSRLVAAEVLKLRTTRTFWGITLAALGLIALVTTLTLALGHHSPGRDVRNVLSNAGIIGLFVLLLGVIGMTGEYRHGTVTSTFLAAPIRSRVILAKAVAYFVAGAVIGVAATALNIGIVLIWLAVGGDHTGLSSGDIALIALGSIGYAGLAAGLGLGIGGLLRNQIAAVCVLVALVFIVDPVISGLVAAYGKWSVTGLGVAMSGGTSSDGGGPQDLFAAGVAALVLLGYVALACLAASAVTARRDVL
jgi:ABC-2 type transport system permease protein